MQVCWLNLLCVHRPLYLKTLSKKEFAKMKTHSITSLNKKVISKDDKNDDHRMLNLELRDYYDMLDFELITSYSFLN